MKVVLVGMMGSGKSATARSLGRLLGWPVVDTDQSVRAASGTSIPDLFAREGEAGFRARELAAVRHALGLAADVVVAVGGGAITTPEVRDALAAREDVVVVHLRTSEAEVVRRVGDGAGRPMLRDDPAAAVARLAAERAPLYESAATMTVDTDGRSIDEVAAEVAAGLRSRGAVAGVVAR